MPGKPSEAIRFISQRRYRWLGNFSPSPIRIGDFDYPTVEHAYQAAKTNHQNWRSLIRGAATPKLAKQLGRQAPLRADWDEGKLRLMHRLVTTKFEQNPKLAEKLIATGNCPIEEDAAWDTFWGTGSDGLGQNYMGHILMDVRLGLRRSGGLWAPSEH